MKRAGYLLQWLHLILDLKTEHESIRVNDETCRGPFGLAADNNVMSTFNSCAIALLFQNTNLE